MRENQAALCHQPPRQRQGQGEREDRRSADFRRGKSTATQSLVRWEESVTLQGFQIIQTEQTISGEGKG